MQQAVAVMAHQQTEHRLATAQQTQATAVLQLVMVHQQIQAVQVS
jgi:hypothetical protein